MGHESLIMQRSDIGAISDSIKDCLRCGKCKPVCATHVPRANLLYSPRNKILATSLLIEAFLYEEQTRRGISLQHWEEFEDVADHCTVCHKCASPCPVKIDFGDVTMNMRNLLRKMGQKSWRPGKAAAMLMLNATRPQTIKLMRTAMVDVGFKAQRLAVNDLLARFARKQTSAAAGHRGAGADARADHPLRQQEDARRAAQEDRARAARHRGQGLRPHHPQPSQHHVRHRGGVLLPRLRQRAPVQPGGPGHAGHALACRRADRAAARLPVLRLPAARLRPVRQGREDDHRQPGAVPPRGQHAELPGHQDRGGELRHLLRPAAGLPFEDIFPGCRIIDIHEYLLEKGITLPNGGAYLYHDPCHSPMKQQEPMKTVKALVGEPQVLKSERCCGESGTLGVTRPDISTQIRFRKEEELRKNAALLAARGRRREDPDQLPELPAGPERATATI
jgi:ferredoxin